jgi:nicotinamide-nucleotide amidase
VKAEIIAVGTELLMGDVVNTNATWLSKELAALGVDVYHHVAVGDNPARIRSIITQAMERADLLIFTGGLGPTEDDLTVATLAAHFNTPLVTDLESEETIRNFFIARGMPMSSTNLKQAKRPEEAAPIKNPIGTAPGIAWDLSGKTGKTTYILAFPGVPRELYAMWPQGQAFIRQKQQAAGESVEILAAKFLNFFGIGESKLGEVLADLMRQANPTVAPYVGNAEVRIRIAAKAHSPKNAEALMAPVKAEILKRCGAYYYGDDDASLELCVSEILTAKGLSLTVAESCTGGLISSRLTDIPGSSGYIFGNVVTYSNAEKVKLLNVRPETIVAVGAVSPEVAAQMAIGVRERGSYDIGLSVTGIAGPGGDSEEKPTGLAYIGICLAHQGMHKNAKAKKESNTNRTGDSSAASPRTPPSSAYDPQSGALHPSLALAESPECAVLVKKVVVNPHYSRKDIKHWFSQYALAFLLQALRGTLETDYPALFRRSL